MSVLPTDDKQPTQICLSDQQLRSCDRSCRWRSAATCSGKEQHLNGTIAVHAGESSYSTAPRSDMLLSDETHAFCMLANGNHNFIASTQGTRGHKLGTSWLPVVKSIRAIRSTSSCKLRAALYLVPLLCTRIVACTAEDGKQIKT